MERINTLLDKLRELNSRTNNSAIEIDLMMDYTRVLYADLLEWRSKVAFTEAVTLDAAPQPAAPATESVPPPVKGTEPTPLATATASPATPPPRPAEPSLSAHQSFTDIRQRIGINDKYQYISELFGNNKEAYEEVITEVNSFETEDEAVSWISQNVAPQFDWKGDTESVQSFYRMLSEYFAETHYSK